MGSPFVPLALDLVDEGRVLEQFNLDLRAAQVAIVDHLREYKGLAEKSKAVVRLELTLTCESPDDSMFSVMAETRLKLPNRPATITLALADQADADGLPALFVRRSGSTPDTPRQAVLTTQDGRAVDPATGEAADKAAGKTAGKK